LIRSLVQVNDLVVVGLRDEKRRHESGTDRSESRGHKRSDHCDTNGRTEQPPVLPFHPWHDFACLPFSCIATASGVDRLNVAASGDAPDDEAFWRLRHEHPGCSYEDLTGDFSPRKLSDFVTVRQLKRLQIYTDLFRVGGLTHEISVGLPAPLTHTKMFLFANGAERGTSASASGRFSNSSGRTSSAVTRPCARGGVR